MSHILKQTASSITFRVPTVTDKLRPFILAVKEAEAIHKAGANQQTSKDLRQAKDRFESIEFALIESDPDEMTTELWEQYHRCRNMQDRKILKQRYNKIANEINTQLKRKVYLLIH